MSNPLSAGRALRSCAILCAVVLLIAAAGRAQAQADASARLSGYVTVASDARSHGLSQLYDGSASVQLGIDYESPSRFFAGGVVSNVDYATETSWPEPRELLVNVYAGYLWQHLDWNVTFALSHYRYPDSTFDYDYSELTALVDLRERFFYRFAYTNELLSFDQTATNQELGVAWPLPWDIEVSASLGKFDSSEDAASYTHYNIGLSKLIGPFGLDLRFYETSREVVGNLGSSAGDRWVLSLSYAIDRQR